MATATKQTEDKAKQEVEDVIDILEPKHEPKLRVLVDSEGNKREYIQKPLTFFNKTKFLALVGEAIDAVTKEGGSVMQMLDAEELTVEAMGSLDSFIKMIARIAQYTPDFLKNCYLLWLNVPHKERPWASVALDEISDEDGIDIIETFIDQNWEALESFFNEHARKISKRVEKVRKAHADAQP